MKPIHAILFDLDGTLLDTAHDLGAALNQLLQDHQLPVIPLETLRPAAGSGSRGLLKLGMDVGPDDPRYPALSEQLLAHYQRYLLDNPHFFPGMEKILTLLDEKAIPWGIVTNKPAKYTEPLLAHLKLDQRAGCVISGDSLPNRKPHPEPILHACRLLQKLPENCLYIGDSAIDIEACRAAGVPSLAALYGYIPQDENPETWGADGYIREASEIIDWL